MAATVPAPLLRELYGLAFERSPAIVAVVDAELRYVAASLRWRRMFGLETEPVLGHVHSGPRLASWEERLTACLDGEDQRVDGDRLDGPGGSIAYVDWEAARLVSPSGLVLGASVAIRPTARSDAARSDQRYRTLVQNLPDFVSNLDRDGVFQLVNFVFPGLSESDVVGKSVREFMAPAEHEKLLRAIHSAFDHGETTTLRSQGYGRDGSSGHYVNRVFPIYEDGKVVSATVVTTDVTQQVEAERQREKLEQQLLHGQKLESLGVLAGGIAHDFNNMLMAMLGSASVALQKLPEGSPAAAHLARVERSARRASELCQQLLAYAGKGTTDMQPVDLSAEVVEAAQLLEVSRPKSVRLDFACAPGLPAVAADVGQLRQVVMNLMINASDAIGAASGTIRVETGVERLESRSFEEAVIDEGLVPGEYVFVRVTDDGQGMDAETRRRMFDPFFTTKRHGHGLGMAAVLGIVRAHRGTLRVDSEPGRGTTITVYLPATDATPRERVEERVVAADWRGSGTALLVDDEPAVREVVGMMLEDIGFTVVPASEGEDAVGLLETKPSRYDLALLDLHMPGMPSLETLGALRVVRPGIPVRLTSGYGPSEEVQAAVREPATGFLQKPYRLGDLRGSLRAILGR